MKNTRLPIWILDELLAEDAVIVGPDGESYSKAFILDAHRPPKRAFFEGVFVTERVLKNLGSTVICSSTTVFENPGRIFSLKMTRVT